RVIFRFESFKVVELVEPQNAQVPQLGVENLPFLHQEFAPDHAVAGGGIALKLDASHRKRLSFVRVDVDRDQLVFVVDVKSRNRGKIDEAQGAVGLAQVFRAFLQKVRVKRIPIFDGELGSQL